MTSPLSSGMSSATASTTTSFPCRDSSVRLLALKRIGIHARKRAREMMHAPGWGHWIKGESGERVYTSRCDRCGLFIEARQYINVYGRKTDKGFLLEVEQCPGPT